MLTLLDGDGKSFRIERYTWDAGIRDIKVPGHLNLGGPFKAICYGTLPEDIICWLRGTNLGSSTSDVSSFYTVDIRIEECNNILWFKRFHYKQFESVNCSIFFAGLYLGE